MRLPGAGNPMLVFGILLVVLGLLTVTSVSQSTTPDFRLRFRRSW